MMTMTMTELRRVIDDAFGKRGELRPDNAPAEVVDAVRQTLTLIDNGDARVAEPMANADNAGGDNKTESAKAQAAKTAARWQTNEWLKKAVLLSFRLSENVVSGGGKFYDKVPLKYDNCNAEAFAKTGVRVVPGAVIRRGSYIAPKVVVMPSFVNIGAYIGEGAMIDTWATVGSCAQIGAGVHLSGGAGIGGVLEPLQASPTIIEDNCFIGARSEVVEGAIIGTGSVLAMGVFIGKSTRIYDRESGEIFYGAVPPYSVVVPGTLPSPDNKYALACAIIVKRVDEKTRAKTALNDLLRPD